MQNYTGADAEALVKDAIANKVKANNGIFPFDDPLNGDHLKLTYDDVDFTHHRQLRFSRREVPRLHRPKKNI